MSIFKNIGVIEDIHIDTTASIDSYFPQSDLFTPEINTPYNIIISGPNGDICKKSVLCVEDPVSSYFDCEFCALRDIKFLFVTGCKHIMCTEYDRIDNKSVHFEKL